MSNYYTPPPYYPRRGEDRTADLIMAGGRAQAEGAQRSGDIWGGTLAGVGQTLAGGFQQAGEQKALRKRDEAWLTYVDSGEWAKDPAGAYKMAVRTWGPEKGPAQFQALQGAITLMGDKRDPEQDRKSLGAIVGAMDALKGDAARARLYPQALALAKRAYPDLQLEEEYNPERWPEISAVGAQLRGDRPPEGFTLAPGQKRFGPDGQPLAEVPPEPEKPQTFTLGPGEVRYGPDGKPIAARPPAPDKPSKERFWVIRNGDPVRITESEYRPGDQPASTREQGRPVTSGDAGRVADLDTSLDDLNALSGAITEKGATGALAKAGAMAPNVITEWTGFGADAKKKQAMIDRVKQVIGKALEEGVLRKEDEIKYEKILPTIGDPPELVQSKLDGLWAAIQRRRQTTLDSLADAGYDISKYAARAPRERTAPSARPAPLAPIRSRETGTGRANPFQAGQPQTKKTNPFR